MIRQVVIGCVFVIAAACGTGPNPSRPGGAPSADPAAPAVRPSPSGPIATSRDPSAAWSLAGIGDDSAATQLHAVVAVADGFVATGSRGQAGEVPVAFHSVDGSTWTAEAISGRFGSPSRLLAWDERVLGIGNGETDRCAHPYAMDTWVRSADGTWAEAPFDRLFCDNGGVPVVLDGRIWIAGAVRDIPALMVSDDGLVWTNKRDRLGDLYPTDAIVDGSGLWILARDAAGGSVALHSRDGTAFERRPVTTAAGLPVDVLAGVVLDGAPLLLVTRDGILGTLRPDDAGGWRDAPATGLPPRSVAAVLPIEGHLVALGSDDNGLPLAFTSADGSSWAPIPLPAGAGPGTTLFGLAVANRLAVLVGQIESPDGSGAVGAIWTGSPALLAP
ncbi:MAG TPA: hypothetical protein VM427_07680 [Patescibacteria group bacterium]|nr:hypothetical protein [Patescibacteria group bacterium]